MFSISKILNDYLTKAKSVLSPKFSSFQKHLPVLKEKARYIKAPAVGAIAILAIAAIPTTLLLAQSPEEESNITAAHTIMNDATLNVTAIAHDISFDLFDIPTPLARSIPTLYQSNETNTEYYIEANDADLSEDITTAIEAQEPENDYLDADVHDDTEDAEVYELLSSIVTLSSVELPDEDAFEYDNEEYVSAALEFELSAATKVADEEPIISVAEVATRGQVINLAGTTAGIVTTELKESNGVSPTTSTGSFIWPTQGRLSSLFGLRRSAVGSSNHRGIDISGPMGTPIFAADGGEVIFSGWSGGGFGFKVLIEHDNGIITLYAHNSLNIAQVGDRVYQGQIIAEMGRTGTATGVHLHFEVIIDGVQVDPLLHLPRVTAQ